MSYPDIQGAVVAFLRTQSAIVLAFGDNPSLDPPAIHFWSKYAGPEIPALPFLNVNALSDSQSFETIDPNDEIGPMTDGTAMVEVAASSETAVGTLADQIEAALTDPDLAIANTGLIYFRPTGRAFPIVTAVGPDGQPTYYARVVQFRYMTEPATS